MVFGKISGALRKVYDNQPVLTALFWLTASIWSLHNTCMSIQRKNTSARMSQIVTHNGTVYLAGQVASDFSADVETQMQSTLDKIDALLAQAGTDKTRLLSATIYLKDIASDFAKINPIWEAWVPEGAAPARACVQAEMARASILVEISIVAATA